MVPPQLMITADDFGLHPDISEGIFHCIRGNLITAISCVPCDDPFHRGLLLRIVREYPHIRIGVHLTLIDVPPLTESMRRTLHELRKPSFQDYRDCLTAFCKGMITSQSIMEEWRAQISFFKAMDIPITHVNSHQHLHVFPGFWNAALSLRRKFAIPYLRIPYESLARSVSFQSPIAMLFQTLCLGRLLAARGRLPTRRFVGFLTGTRFTVHDNLAAIRSIMGNPHRQAELMVHPGFASASVMAQFGRWHASWQQEIGELKKLSCLFIDGVPRKSVAGSDSIPGKSEEAFSRMHCGRQKTTGTSGTIRSLSNQADTNRKRLRSTPSRDAAPPLTYTVDTGSPWIDFCKNDRVFSLDIFKTNMALFTRSLEKLLPLSRDDAVLDIGCGPGCLVEWLLPRVRTVVGIDIAPQYVDRCRTVFGSNPSARFFLLGEDYLDFSMLEGMRFSRFICLSVVQYYRSVNEVERLIRSVRRLALPGAQLLIADIPPCPQSPFRLLFSLVTAGRRRCLLTQVRFVLRALRSDYASTYSRHGLLYLDDAAINRILKRLNVAGRLLREPMTMNVHRKHLLISV